MLERICQNHQNLLDSLTFDILTELNIGMDVQLMKGDMITLKSYDCLERKFTTSTNNEIKLIALSEIELHEHLKLIKMVRHQGALPIIQMHMN